MPEQSKMLPLLVGRDGFPETPLKEDSSRGMLVVRGEPQLRDGIVVQRCLCGCSQRACGLGSDVDVRFLNDPSNFEAGECVFRGPSFFPPYSEVVEAARALGITDTAKYREAFARGRLPRCSPFDPSEYREWISWADFTGIPNYHSDAELYDGLIALDLHELALLPTPELRRFLLSCEYWASIRAKAASMGIAEADIPANIGRIAEALYRDSHRDSGPRMPTPADMVGTGSAPVPPTPLPQSLTLSPAQLVNTVTKWLPNSIELQQEIITGFYCNAWEILARQDALEGNGFEYVRTTILDKLTDVKPQLVTEFLRQYDGAAAFHVNGRNWMQAYSRWYSEEHFRFINWSSAGLGKTRTIPAMVSAYGIHFTIIISPKKITNNKNPQLVFELLTEDPKAVIHYSDYGVPTFLAPGLHHYFVCNSEKLQQGAKTRRMIDALIAHRPGLIAFDEGHLLVSCNLVDPELGEKTSDTKYKPRMEGLRYLLDELGPGPEPRIVVLTGTPVRVDAREGQALFELIGVEVGEFDKEMSELNALRLRGQLQQNGFQFLNYGLPELRRFIYPFKVPSDVAAKLNGSDLSTLDKEVIRMEYALQNIYSLCGKSVINTERVPLSLGEATPVDSRDSIYDLAELIELATDKEAKAQAARQTLPGKASSPNTAADSFEGCSALDRQRFPVVKLNYEPLDGSVNPIFFTYFVDGPSAVVSDFLTSRNIRHLRCTGDSDDAELGKYLTQKDSSLIASSSWSVGVDGSQKVSNALVTLGIPWHDSGHRQTVARIHRQGAETPDGTPTTVIHEIIPVAVNVNYDVKRLNKVYARRTFTEILSLGEVKAQKTDGEGRSKKKGSTKAEIADELKAAIRGLLGKQIDMPLTHNEEELATL